MEKAREVSVPLPTKWIPFSLKCSLSVMSAVCYLHEKELDRELDPLAYDPALGGWPESIDWKKIPHRVIRMQECLQRIVEDIDHEWQTSSPSKRTVRPLEEDLDLLAIHPRTESYFWKGITNDIIVHGLRYIKDLDGQTEIYKRTKPG